MCGIFGYCGEQTNATKIVMEGLKRLDYRGYDSWGISIIHNQEIVIDKHIGIVNKNLLDLPASSIAIGHTRWATNGAVTLNNAHPHLSRDKSFALAHNGIVENYQQLKNKLTDLGYQFITQTDTETVVYLIEENKKHGYDLIESVRLAFNKLSGRNTIIVLSKENQIITARNGSPMVIGESDNLKQIFFSSDALSFAPFTHRMLILENRQMAVFQNHKLIISDSQSAKPIQFKFEVNHLIDSVISKDNYDHFMIKEIHEEPDIIEQVISQPKNQIEQLAQKILKSRSVYCIGSGTAGIAAAQIAYYLRVYGNIPAIGLIGSESSDYLQLFGKNDLIITPSQSGETADVLEVIEAAKKRGTKIASYVNLPGSMITRLSDYKFMADAGPEICVMSTKIFVSQIAWGYRLAKAVQGKLQEGDINLKILATNLKIYLKNQSVSDHIQLLAKNLADKSDVFILSKGQNLQIIKEAMVKIIEGAYIHAHAIPAGDLKHYAITLMEPGVMLFVVLSEDSVKTDILNAVHEVKARGTTVVGLAPHPQIDFDDYLEIANLGEVSAIANIIPFQLLAYYTAKLLNHNIDKPRNIAKSVTVK
jgi:glutamine---fructose-6-phosphate transaminase (isomerizing)